MRCTFSKQSSSSSSSISLRSLLLRLGCRHLPPSFPSFLPSLLHTVRRRVKTLFKSTRLTLGTTFSGRRKVLLGQKYRNGTSQYRRTLVPLTSETCPNYHLCLFVEDHDSQLIRKVSSSRLTR